MRRRGGGEQAGKTMIQIIFHALGGQGAKSAAEILAEAAFLEGKEIQAFPEYGPERRGTPVRAFVRISDRKITTHEPIVKPDYSIIIDPSLITKERMSGVCIVNSAETVDSIKKKTGYKGQMHVLDAGKIIAFANLPMLAAFVKVSDAVRLESVLKQTEALFGRKMGPEKMNQTIDAMKRAYETVK
ncbi:MAG: 2-oxoacid:acceptor oxidoreductase family protein [Candidatus Aenigmatarchaeota archaeon]